MNFCLPLKILRNRSAGLGRNLLSNKSQIGRQSTYFKTFAGIIWFSGAASITDCQVFVEPGITNPNSNNHSVINTTIALDLHFFFLFQQKGSDIFHISPRKMKKKKIGCEKTYMLWHSYRYM